MSPLPSPPARQAERPITNNADARTLIGHLCDVMDALLDTVDKETALMHAGRLADAAALEQTKTELASLYLADAERIKANRPFLAQNVPQLLDDVRRRHDDFQALLKINLTVLATAHAVSESIIRGVAGEVARKAVPQVYGAGGRANAPGRNAIAPVTLSRSL